MHNHNFEGQSLGRYLVSYVLDGQMFSSWRRGRKCKTCPVVKTGG